MPYSEFIAIWLKNEGVSIVLLGHLTMQIPVDTMYDAGITRNV